MASGIRAVAQQTFNAEAAVLLFFVLSGCVLGLSLQGSPDLGARSIGGFYIKRVFRIYPLLWLATGVAMISLLVTRHLVETGVFVDWLARNLTTPVSARLILLSLTGMFTRYNGPMWSLRIELIYSAVFPAIYWLMRNNRLRIWALALLTLLALLPVPTQLGLPFALSFAAGAVIPLLPARGKLHGGVTVLAGLVILYDRLALAGLNLPDRYFDIIETAAAFVIVRDVYASGRSYLLLESRAVQWLGDVSFGVYLLHLPILLMLFAAAQRVLGLATLLDHPALAQLGLGAVTIVLTAAAAGLTYKYLELPAHNAGRRLAKRVALGQGAWQALQAPFSAKLPAAAAQK